MMKKKQNCQHSKIHIKVCKQEAFAKKMQKSLTNEKKLNAEVNEISILPTIKKANEHKRERKKCN